LNKRKKLVSYLMTMRLDAPDLRIFGFHANINKAIRPNEYGQIAGDVYLATDGRWTFEDSDVTIKNGDILRYWIYVQANGANYKKENQRWTYFRKIIYINTQLFSDLSIKVTVYFITYIIF